METYYTTDGRGMSLTDAQAATFARVAADLADASERMDTHQNAVILERESVDAALVLLDRTPPIVPVNGNA